MFRSTAHIYDLIYSLAGKDYAAESAVIAEQIHTRNPGATTLLDVACGTGAHLEHLRGQFEVVGVDLDPAMLAEARTRLPETELVEGDMRSFDLGRRFDAVVCLFAAIGYVADHAELDRAVATMASHLAPRGVLIVDSWVRTDAWRDDEPVHAISGVRDGVAVARVGRSERFERRTVLDMHHLVATAQGVEHLVDRHELTSFTRDEHVAAFEQAGLTVEVTPGISADGDRYIGVAPA